MFRKNLQETYNESEEEDDEEKRTLFCANLDERVTEDLLYEIFIQAGPIESARIPKDHTGKQRTFGFITYVHKLTLPYAMQLYQGLSLYRKTVAIKYQGNTQPSPMSYVSPGHSNERFMYDNASLRGASYSSYNEGTPRNPFRNSYSPDYPIISSKRQDNVLKYTSSQRRPHTNASPYHRKGSCSGDSNRDRERERDHNKRRQYNNGSNRHSEQRSGDKNRR